MTPYASALSFEQPFDTRRGFASASRITSGPMAAVWSCLISASVALGFLAFDARILHWFLIPLTLCGCLIGIDMVKWMTNRLDLYDATGLIALLGYHFFFIAPLLMITLEYRMKYLSDQPEDYRDWLGAMALLNFAGLLLYKVVVHYVKAARTRKAHLSASQWQIAPRRFWILWMLFLLLSAGAQVSIFVAFGGVRGYIATYSQWLSGHDMFQGWALLFAVAESLPVLLTIGLAVYWRKRGTSAWTVTASVFALACLILVTGGLRGSRSNVIWGLFWVLGIIHFYVKRLPRALGPVALCLLYVFVSVYAAYKQHGGQLLDRIAVSGDYSSVSGGSEGPATVLVGDFSRCDVQAFLLYKLIRENAFQYAHGASYLGAITMIVPRSLWQDRPATVARWTTDAEYGEGAYQASAVRSSRVYGIAGEAMLNFGPAGVLVAYIVLGLLTAMLHGVISTLSPGDGRWLIAPFFINLLFLLLLNDSDNATFYLIKYGLMPFALVLLSTTRRNIRRIPNGSNA
jgi:hypothetical protein